MQSDVLSKIIADCCEWGINPTLNLVHKHLDQVGGATQLCPNVLWDERKSAD
ncbi:hypothetical protein RMSM_00250 [Rhodopirellula maiorica SM1]|uniref:Uncharacterized protein n=1 Tax=Rhodopirellula maiorica SM1 TaxID=1265738 RepID=M5S9H5_9BACT|nr:hypothetical protein RMSM_00250 [Rhodopirellula maiorica SM1]